MQMGFRGLKVGTLFLGALLMLSAGPAAAEQFKPKYGPQATRISKANDYFREAAAPDYWALSPYYAAQYNGRACSVGSVAMVVNAARADQDLIADEKLVTQQDLLDKAGSKLWKRAVGAGGQGVTLDQLGELIKRSLNAYGFPNAKVEVVHLDQAGADAVAKLREVLARNEKSAGDFIVLNFVQGVYTGDADVGHISPVGAYDSKRDRVLVMDVDREWYEPYWVPVETVAKGMATRDKSANKNRGYVYVTPGKVAVR